MPTDNELITERYKEVVSDTQKVDTFITKRAAGAKKIQLSAKAKGGYSKLTEYHFAAKAPAYHQALTHIGDLDFLEDKITECFDKLKSWKTLSQHDFQVVMGQLEAFGEVFLDIEHPKTY